MKHTLTIMKPIVILLLLSLVGSSYAQTLYSIKGKVADSTLSRSLDYATVTLKTGNGTVLSTMLTRENGSFRFSGLKPSAYSVTIASVGYKTTMITVYITDSVAGDKDIGTIYISNSSSQLKQVTITADKLLVRQETDRLIYDLQADPDSKVSSVLDMMRKVPYLTLDAEDNILLKGNSSYRILINGKPSSMVEHSPKDILRSMPASTIEKIEVITTPPAKYDGEGLIGIINIITNKKADNGYSGSVNVSERFPAGGPGGGGSFTVRTGRFGTSLQFGGNVYTTPTTGNSNNRSTFGATPTNLIQNGFRESDSKSGYIGTELTYEIDTLNLISVQLNINGNRAESLNHQLTVINSGNDLLHRYDLANNNSGSGNGKDASINYQVGFRSNKNRLLTFSYRFLEFGNKQFNRLAASGRINYPAADYQQQNISESTENTLQIDYLHPLKKLDVEAGIKGILRRNNSVFQHQTLINSPVEPDPSGINRFNNTQNIFGFYNAYQYNLKSWGFKAGIRIEETVTDADATSESGVKQHYFNVIPSISINRKFTNTTSLNFGYTSRIQRPGMSRLNPFVDRSNPNFETTGNPDLRPVTGSMLQLNFSRFQKTSINAGVSYMFISNIIMPLSTFDPATDVTRTTYQNMGKARLLGTNFNINVPITNKWNYTANGQFNYGWVQSMVDGIMTSNKGLMPYLFTSSSYRSDKGLRLSANVSYNGQNISLQGKSNAFINSSFSIGKDIFKDKLTFSAALNNPLTKYRNAINLTQGSDFTQRTFTQSYLRSVYLSLNYRFGALKEQLKKNKRGIRNDDLTGGGNSL